MLFLFASLVFLIVVLAFISLSFPKKSSTYRYALRPYLLTHSEITCYHRLVNGLGSKYAIFAQIHLLSLFDEKKFRGQNWLAARAHINQKSVDFLLCDKDTLTPVLAIELDDPSHLRKDRQARDREVERICFEAGLPLLRITRDEDPIALVREKLVNPQLTTTSSSGSIH